MADLTPIEKRYIEDLLEMKGGYVLDLTNYTFAELFENTIKINIYDEKYSTYGDSKAKRLRSFWEQESNNMTGKILNALLEQWKYVKTSGGETIETPQYDRCLIITNRLSGKIDKLELTEDDFLKKEFTFGIKGIYLTAGLSAIIEQRLAEAQKCLDAKAPLSVIFLTGSILEGILLDIISQNPKQFNQLKDAPRDKNNKVKKFHEWSLAQMIDAAEEAGLLSLDVKKFSHVLRDFRNYIHPREQVVNDFKPDRHTARICLQVLKAAISDLSGDRSK